MLINSINLNLHLVLEFPNLFLAYHEKKVCPRWGSNSRPSDYETDALPTALRRLQLFLVKFLSLPKYLRLTTEKKVCIPTGGLEPPIFGLGDRRLIHWATRALLCVDSVKTRGNITDISIVHARPNWQWTMNHETSSCLNLQFFAITHAVECQSCWLTSQSQFVFGRMAPKLSWTKTTSLLELIRCTTCAFQRL